MVPKPQACKGCPLTSYTGEEWVGPYLTENSDTLIVGEAAGEEEAKCGEPFVGGAGQWLNNMLAQARIPRTKVSLVNVMSCRPPENVFPGDEKCTWCTRDEARWGVEYCKNTYLWPTLKDRKWRKIITLGNKALHACTGRIGIELWRGSPLPLENGTRSVVIPTIHPAALMRQATLTSVAIGDMRKQPSPPPERYKLYPSLQEVKDFTSKIFAFDFEWDRFGNITMCGLTDKFFEAIVVPMQHGYIDELRRIFESAEVLIGHNIIGADTRHISILGWDISRAKLVDTMLMQHLTQPDYRHGLSFVASVFTNKVFWKGKDSEEEEYEFGSDGLGGAQYKTWNHPQAIPRLLGGYGGCRDDDEAYRLYNARDTDASFQISFPLQTDIDRYNLRSIYDNVSVPLAYICRELGQRGLKINKTRITDVRQNLDKEITRLDATLPEGLRSYKEPVTKQIPAPEGTYKSKIKLCKGSKKLPHPEWRYEFTAPGTASCETCGKNFKVDTLPIVKRIKVEDFKYVTPWTSSKKLWEYAKSKGCSVYTDRKTGNISTGKNARKIWGRNNYEFAVVDELKEYITLRNNFAKDKLMLEPRMYFNLLVHGTSEGRLSSTGQRRGVDLNIQNIPEEIKIIFEPDREGWGFLDFDVSQGENLLRAWFAKDWELLERIKSGEFDEHSHTASSCFGVTVTKTNEHRKLRKAGKVINHAIGYGGGKRTVQQQLAVEGFYYTEKDCQEMIDAWRRANPCTYKWQQETANQARAQGFLINPFGRRRWFQMRDVGPKALAFLPASTLADCVLRMMIAMHSDWVCDGTDFWAVCNNLGIQERMRWENEWRMVTQVHDSIVAQGPWEWHAQVAEDMRRVMTQPWQELGGFSFAIEGKGGTKSLGEMEVKV